jgi:hypothetical protein
MSGDALPLPLFASFSHGTGLLLVLTARQLPPDADVFWVPPYMDARWFWLLVRTPALQQQQQQDPIVLELTTSTCTASTLGLFSTSWALKLTMFDVLS